MKESNRSNSEPVVFEAALPSGWLLACCLILFCFTGYGEDSSPGKTAHEGPAKQRARATNAAIAEFEPALAIRASACITCHARIHPGYITDFGHGDRYFFGKPGGGSAFGPFNGSIYGDFYGGEPEKTGWLTAEIGRQIIVPEALFDFDLSAAGSKLASHYKQPLQATSLAKYLQALESQKPNPATVIEKKEVFIGAPTAATLEKRFNLPSGSDTTFKYIEDRTASPQIKGIALSPGKDFFTNTGEVVCDGDLFLRGTLFLNNVTLSTRTGCRIYTTGATFLQGGVSYKNLGDSGNMANLQLVSAEAILLGVGDKSCEATSTESPLSRRLVSGYAVSSFFTRAAAARSISPKEFGQGIYVQGKSIASLQDASCQDEGIGFSRLLLNAPQVHIRYKGKIKGLVIAEVALFARGKSTHEFEFDPVFKSVPVLPRLEESDYLQVK